MITDTYLHDPPPFNSPFFMTPPFSAVSKSCDPPYVSTPPPRLLISDKSLSVAHYFMRYSHPFVLYQAHVCGVLDIQKRTEKNPFFASE